MSAAPTKTSEIFVVKNVPTDAEVTEDAFGLREVDVPALADNSLLIRTLFIGLEPYMRVFCLSNPRAWPVDSVPSGKVVGEVIQSTCDRFAPGDMVKVGAKWRTVTWVVADEKTLIEKLDAAVPAQFYLGLGGSGGRSAHLPMKHIVKPKAGQTAVVTAASSCVGLAAVQLLRLDGVTVLGSAGSEEKVALLKSLGCAAWNYKTESTGDALGRLSPDGVDFLLDMVGGEMRVGVMERMKQGGSILTLGSMSKYDGGGGHSLGSSDEREAALIAEKGLSAHQGNVNKYEDEFEACTSEILGLYKQGKLVSKDTVVDGLEKLPAAFVGIFKGANIGRMVVKVA
jgi:NADPH-dependent curcumin reductase CurA